MTEEAEKVSWQERRWMEIRGWITFAFIIGLIVYPLGDTVKDWISPNHPAPVSIEADGKNYVACNTPDIGRGYFHGTYYADFKDNNSGVVSLRGIDQLIVNVQLRALGQNEDHPSPQL